MKAKGGADVYEQLATQIIDCFDNMKELLEPKDVIIGLNVMNDGKRLKSSSNDRVSKQTFQKWIDSGNDESLETIFRSSYVNEKINTDKDW